MSGSSENKMLVACLAALVRARARGTMALSDRDVEREYVGQTQVEWTHDERAHRVLLAVGPLPPPVEETK